MDTLIRTDIKGRVIPERRHWSYSALDKFHKCARKFYHYEVAKTVTEPENPQMKEGFFVHKSMADFILKGTPLPSHLEPYREWPSKFITGLTGEKVLVEHRMAMTFDLKPCEYFSRVDKVWLRAQGDLLVINGEHAKSIDWKTGAQKDDRYEELPPNFQLKLVALLIFLNFPQVKTTSNSYVWLKDGEATTFDMARDDIRWFIPQMYDTVTGYQHAFRTGQFPPRPSGLCKRHCAVASCEYWGKGG